MKVLLAWILTGVVGLLIAFRFFFVAFPEAALDLRISRGEALERGRQFLQAQGYPLKDYQSSIIFSVDDNAKTYLERELGLQVANRLMASEVSIWHWTIRFFRPLQKEEFRVEVDPAGRIVGWRHDIEEGRAGAQLEKDAAQKIAADFLQSRLKMDLSAYDFLSEEANSKERPKRLDWSFTWERHGFKAKDAPYRLRVTVLGDSVGGYDEFLKVPEDWERDFKKLRSSNELFQWLGQLPGIFLQGAVLVVLLDLGRRGQIRWRGALKLGLVLAALFFVMQANSWPLARSEYDTNSSYSGFFLLEMAQALVGSALLGMLVALTVAAAEPLYRHAPWGQDKLRLGAVLTRSGLRSKEVFRATVIGLSLAAAHIGFVVLFYVVGRRFGFWAPQDVKYSDAVSTALPWIYPLAISVYAATSEEFLFRLFSIPFLLRMTKSKWVAIILPAFVWGFLHSAYPVQPGYARGLEVGLIGIVAGWVMIRWGILATLMWHYTVDASLIGLFLLRSENLYFRLSGAVVAFAVLLPLIFAGFAYLRRREFAADEALFNRAQPAEAPSMEMPAAPAPVATGYEALSPSAMKLAAGLGVLGIVLGVAIHTKAFGDFVQYATTAREAGVRADEVLRAQKVDPERYQHVTTFVSTFNGLAGEYLRRRIGLDGVNRFYKEEVPFAFWRVRYFRDSEKEEYHVVLRLDGTLHAVHHFLDEKAPGANLPKEEAQARAEVYLRDEKKLDLSKWKLVEANSDKQPARTDHTFTWEEVEGVGEAHVRIELKVLGEEVSGYRIYVKLPEEWQRAQEEWTLPRIAQTGFRLLLAVGLVSVVVILLFRNLREQNVPWRRMAHWAMWGALALVVSEANGFRLLLSTYQTEWPLARYLIILFIAQLIFVAIVYSGLFLLFGLAWFFLARGFGEGRLPGWKGMPAGYYRDALVLAVTGVSFWIGFSRLAFLLQRLWPTDKRALSAAVLEGLDQLIPSLTFISGSLMSGLFIAGLVALAGGLLALYARTPWMRAGVILIAGLALAPAGGSAADFLKVYLWIVLLLVLGSWGVTIFYRLNLMAYFLTVALLSLVTAGQQLIRQPATFYRWNGYVVMLAAAALLLWPFIEWRKALKTQVTASPPGDTPPPVSPPDSQSFS